MRLARDQPPIQEASQAAAWIISTSDIEWVNRKDPRLMYSDCLKVEELIFFEFGIYSQYIYIYLYCNQYNADDAYGRCTFQIT